MTYNFDFESKQITLGQLRGLEVVIFCLTHMEHRNFDMFSFVPILILVKG